MTFTAVLTVAVVYVAVKYLNELFPNGIPSQLKIPLAVLIGIGAVFLLGVSDFAKDQEFMGRTLDAVNDGSKVVIGILVGAGAVGVDTGLKTLRNVGENDVPGNETPQGTDLP